MALAITLFIVGMILAAGLMMLVAWLWYTKAFKAVWNQYSGESIPERAEGETRGAYCTRMWPRALAQLFFSLIAVYAVILSGTSYLMPLLIVVIFYLPVLGSRIVWMKGLTAGQKGALLGIDAGYALVALYVAFFFFNFWGTQVLMRLG